jgi:O-antigen ligase
MLLIDDTFDAFSSKPLTGVGYGVVHFYTLTGFVTHNAYLQVLAEIGLPALLVFLFIAFKSFGNLGYAKVRLVGSTDDTENRRLFSFAESLQLALMGYLLVMFLHSFLHDKLLWTMIALSSAVKNIAQK